MPFTCVKPVRSLASDTVLPGVCYRLWSAEDHDQLLPCTPPEILTADVSPLALTLASWGCLADVSGLPWLDQPEPQAMQEATLLLRDLAAVSDKGKLTETGWFGWPS